MNQTTETTKPTGATPSPLAKEIYRQLVRRLKGHDSITYGELATAVSEKIPIHARSPKLHRALGEVTEACRARALPLLAAIVWRNDTQRPSDGYYKLAHPRARSYKSQVAAWEIEHARVLSERDKFRTAL